MDPQARPNKPIDRPTSYVAGQALNPYNGVVKIMPRPRKEPVKKGRTRRNGQGSVYLRKRDQKYIGEVRVNKGTPQERVFRTTPCDTWDEADAALTEIRANKQRGLIAEPTKDRTGDYLFRWLDTIKKHEVKLGTYFDYKQLLTIYVIPAIGHVPLGKLNSDHIQDMYGDMLDRGLSPRTVEYVHAVLKQGLQQATEKRLFTVNPMAAVKKPRVKKREMKTMSPKDAQRFLEVAARNRLHALYILDLTMGMRQGELLGLRWSDIDWEAEMLRVDQQLKSVDGKYVFDAPKTDAGKRTIPLTPEVIISLRRWHTEQGQERFKCGPGWKFPDLVFTTKNGNHVMPSNLRKMYKALLERAGVAQTRFHDLRHTAATLLRKAGTDPVTLQKILGHADYRSTQVYLHADDEDKKEAAQKVSDFLKATRRKAR